MQLVFWRLKGPCQANVNIDRVLGVQPNDHCCCFTGEDSLKENELLLTKLVTQCKTITYNTGITTYRQNTCLTDGPNTGSVSTNATQRQQKLQHMIIHRKEKKWSLSYSCGTDRDILPPLC